MPPSRLLCRSGSVAYEAETDANGQRLIWLPAAVVDRPASLRALGESYSDVILRLAGSGEQNPIA